MSKMRGTFSVFKNGKEVAKSNNIITDAGKISILRYMGLITSSYANHLAIGISETAPQVTDTELGFEVDRQDISVISVNLNTSEVLFKASFPESGQYHINEVGIFPDSGGHRSYNMFAFVKEEFWQGTQYINLSDVRVGGEGSTVPATDTGSVIYRDMQINMSEVSLDDIFRLAINLYDDNCESVILRFIDRDGIESEGTYTIPTYTASPDPQYELIDVDKAAFTNLNGDWANIVRVEVEVTASTGLETSVVLDAIRMIDLNMLSGSEVVAKTKLPSTLVKEQGDSMEIQYTLSIPI